MGLVTWHIWPDEKPEREGKYLVQERLGLGGEIFVAEYGKEPFDVYRHHWWSRGLGPIEVVAWTDLPPGIYSDVQGGAK